jgi:hypothetical protein
LLNIFNNDAFGLVTLTAVINSIDYVPGRAGEMAFAGVAEPLSTTSAAIESDGYSLSLVKSSKRGAPAPKQDTDKGVVRQVAIPHFKIEDTIEAASVQDVRQLGSADTLRSARSVIDRQITKMNQRLDLTLENLRLGALQGIVKDSDATTLLNLYTLFGVAEPTAFDFSAAFGDPTDPLDGFRVQCQEVVRYMKRNIKAAWPSSARVWAFCGDNFFDRVVSSVGVKETAQATALAKITLGSNYAFGVFEFGDIMWENYQGTDDGSTVAVATDDCRFFVVGIPGLYVEYYAPASFFEAVNTVALPRYAKIAPDNRFNEYVEVHTQTNPLPVCTRPLTLVKGTSA